MFGSWFKGKVCFGQNVLAGGGVTLVDKKQMMLTCAQLTFSYAVQGANLGNGAAHCEVFLLQGIHCRFT